ncbi:hypothetical protein SAMN05216169_108310 [Anoxybacillus pushchinoensis]|jgi:hypothetical protein|uniref:Uncharacterized protein n=1 Tax=Anoxybacillus pushchinoensis TaxID=150248 RepID=A0A1I0U4Z8_9BACL|nr:hypothetical protein SAMN05216169_108310 [Anoxybacillus pushchinoensis]
MDIRIQLEQVLAECERLRKENEDLTVDEQIY